MVMLPLHSACLNNRRTLPLLRVAYGALSSSPWRVLFEVDFNSTVALQWLPCQLGFRRVWLRGNLAEAQILDRIAMATSAIAKAATATPSSAGERSIEVALVDCTHPG
jgi:hypothetical protein